MTRPVRLLIPALLTLSFAASGSVTASRAPQSTAGSTNSSPRDVINQYCAGCHNERLKSGELTVTSFDVDRPEENPEVWEKVVRKLRGRMMPPPGRPRPDEKTYDQIVSYLETSLDRAAIAKPNPGRTETFHRLNRTEYQNAVRDLLSVDVDIASLLPKDDSSYGFDNVGGGSLSPTLLERYLGAAQKISRLAIGTPIRTPGASL